MRGFTLIEIMVVIGLLAVVVGFAVPVTTSQLSRNRAIDAAAEISSNMFLFQQNSYSKKDDKRYGMRLNEDSYEMIISDDSNIDEEVDQFVEYEYPDNVTIEISEGSAEEIMFNYSSFRPSESMSFSVRYGISSVKVEINTEGLINYYVE